MIFNGATLPYVIFNGATLPYVIFNGATLPYVIFNGATLRYVMPFTFTSLHFSSPGFVTSDYILTNLLDRQICKIFYTLFLFT